jgi:hypothetical protein
MPDTNAQTTAVAVSKPAREIRVVESVSPIMDTARFEHLGRVASVMAHAGLMPMSLTHVKIGEGRDAKYEPLPFETIQARAFLIANQADLWKADPNAVAQCASLVHGKLMFEGKLVHGLIETRLGIKLRYQFGTYVAATRSIDLTTMPGADDQSLGVLVSGRFQEEDFDREIVGCVGMWHKGAQSPWGAATAWPRQLRYMGAREWARAHSPGLLLGIMTDDEIDAARDDRRETSMMTPAEQPRIMTGFSTAAVAAEESAQETVEEIAVVDAVVEEQEALAEAAEDGVQAGERVAASAAATDEPQTASSSSAPADPGTSVSSSSPEKPSSALNASPSEQELAAEEEEPEQLDVGYPEPGEIYHLEGDTWGSAGRRETYKDGKPFSTAMRNKGFKIYADHKSEGPGGELMAEADQEQISNATDPDGGDDLTGPIDAFDAYTIGLRNVETWEQGNAALNALAQTDAWKEAMGGKESQRIRQARMSLALRGEELKAAGKKWIDVLDSLTAFRCWIEICDDVDAIMGNFQSLVPTPLYTSLQAARRASFEASVKARIKDIQEGRA